MTLHRARLLKVGVAQIETKLGDVESNLRRHLEVMAEARAAKVDLLLFPELSLVGHNPGVASLEVAMGRDDPVLTEIATASGDMCTIAGFVEEGTAAQFYNAAAAFRRGRVEFIHRKINLATYGWLEEGKHYASGRHVNIFDLALPWQASILICADMWNPALVYLAAACGATLLLGPVSSALEAVGSEFDNPGGWDVSARFYSMTYGLPVLIANRVGKESDLTFWGGSRICDPFGTTLAAADGMAEQLVTAELDYDVLRKSRYLLPTVRDSNIALVHREIERIHTKIGRPEEKVGF